jgi:type II secretory ATPase GspE/PulE/Tfp pilus assembly ATPase PilB-like protein
MVWSVLSAAVEVGRYVSWWKPIPLLIVLLLWGRLITWIDKDAQEVLLPRIPLNVANLIGGVLGFFLFFMLPGFAVAMIALCVVVLIEAGVYLGMRSSKVGLSDLSKQFTDWIDSFKGGGKEVKIIQGEVQLIGKGGSLMPAPEAEDPIRPAYEAVQTLLTDPLRRNAERIDLAPVDGSTAIKYVVDGVSYSGNTMERARAASAIEYLKSVSGMDIAEKRKPQSGNMKVSIDGQKRELQIQTAGSSAGEQLRAMIDPKKRHQHRLEDLGMTDEQLDIMKGLIQENTGIVLVSSPRAHGLTTMLYAILRAHDAFLQHIHTIEADQATDLEGITQNKLPSNASPAEEVKQVGWVISQEPDSIMISNLQDPKSAKELIKFAAEGKRVYVGIRAASTFEALAAWRKLVGDDRQAVKELRMIINGRVMRKLCAACKTAYTPDPATLRKLNMDPEKVGTLYQARTQPMRDAKGHPIVCDFCKELYFKGRIGVYEIFLIDEDVRGVVEAGGSLNQLKSIFRKQRGRYLQEAALAQVEAGETSVQEVLRVMKADDKPPPGSSARPASRQPSA